MRRSFIRLRRWISAIRPKRRPEQAHWLTMSPGGDVVFFYDDYNENPSLFELGQAVSGGELIGSMSGTVTLEAAE